MVQLEFGSSSPELASEASPYFLSPGFSDERTAEVTLRVRAAVFPRAVEHEVSSDPQFSVKPTRVLDLLHAQTFSWTFSWCEMTSNHFPSSSSARSERISARAGNSINLRETSVKLNSDFISHRSSDGEKKSIS